MSRPTPRAYRAKAMTTPVEDRQALRDLIDCLLEGGS